MAINYKRYLSILLCFIIFLCFTGCKKKESLKGEIKEVSKIIITEKNVEEFDNPKDIAYVFIEKLSKFSTYEFIYTGNVKAKKGIISYTQKIFSQTVKNNDEFYFSQNTESVLLSTSHQAFFKNNSVVYDSDYKVVNKEAYIGEFGLAPDELVLAGYIINDDTIINAEKLNNEGDGLTYRFVLDGERASPFMKVQMKAFGGLKSYPIFKELVITLKLRNDWVPESLSVNAEYKIDFPIIGEMECTQSLNGVYDKVNLNSVYVPNGEIYLEKLNSGLDK